LTQERHLVDRQTYKTRRSAALAEWQIVMSRDVPANGTAASIEEKLW
jgi:hypothetical protein